MAHKPRIITVVGATASGKTDLARRLALLVDGEIVSADSRQVYKFLDIGTGKDGSLQPNTIPDTQLAVRYPQLRYIDDIPQWLTDFIDPHERYSVADYQAAAYEVIDDIIRRGKTPIITGGTGLYVSAVTMGYDFSVQPGRDAQNPRHSNKTNYNKKAPEWDLVELGINLPREALHQRIDARVDSRLAQGMIEEAQSLITDHGLTTEQLRRFGLEYRYLADHLDGLLIQEQLAEQLKYAIHRYARRQLSWFRNHGNVQWISPTTDLSAILNDGV